jgi:heme-degrading monooxygenase HmoA
LLADLKISKEGMALVLEAAVLNVVAGQEEAFEKAVEAATLLIAATPGFISIVVHRCIETTSRYLLLVQWSTLEDHTVGFRQSDRYEKWREALHHFYDPMPLVEHYGDPLF